MYVNITQISKFDTVGHRVRSHVSLSICFEKFIINLSISGLQFDILYKNTLGSLGTKYFYPYNINLSIGYRKRKSPPIFMHSTCARKSPIQD